MFIRIASPELERLDVAISETQAEITKTQDDTATAVARLQEAIRTLEELADVHVKTLHENLGELRGRRSDEHNRLLQDKRNTLVEQANELARDEHSPYFACTDDDEIFDTLLEEVSNAVRGQTPDDWAERILAHLQYHQQFGGLRRIALSALDNDYGRFLTEKQADRAWNVLASTCTDRSTDSDEEPRLGTPYQCYRTDDGFVLRMCD